MLLQRYVTRGKMYLYYRALRLKWCTLNWLSGLTLGVAISFYTPLFLMELHTVESRWGLAIVFSIIYASLFYGWSFENENRAIGKVHSKIFEYSYHRVKYLPPKKVFIEASLTLVLICISAIFILWAWINPAISTISGWLVGLFAGALGGYATREEFSAPRGKKQSVVFVLSISMFILILLTFLYVSMNGVMYSESNSGLPIFVVTTASWVAFGILGTVLSIVSKKLWNKFFGT